MSLRGTVGAICGQSDELHFSWRVEDFSLLSGAVSDCYNSPTFRFSGRRFSLLLFPNGIIDLNTKGWIGLFLVIGESCPPMEVRYTMGVKSAKGHVEKLWRGMFTYRRSDSASGFPKCMKVYDLFLRRQELVPRNTLTITVTLESARQPLGGESHGESICVESVPHSVPQCNISALPGTTDVAVQTCVEDIVGRDDHHQTPENTGTTDVAVQTCVEGTVGQDGGHQPPENTDFATFCQNIEELKGNDSDVTLEVKGMKFRVHKSILEVRTPSLAAMFSDNASEAELAVVSVEDCHPEAFEVFLRFVYSGVAENLTSENVTDVYYVANKYDLPRLKKECVRHMLSNLTTVSVCSVIDMADRHGEDLLKERATEFLVENAREIFRTAVWLKFTEENSLAYDLIIRVHKNWK